MSFVSWLSKISFFQTFSSFLFRFFHSITFLTLCIDLSRTIFDLLRAIMTTSSAGGFLCGYKPVVLAGSKEPLKIRHAHSYHRQALKGFSLCLVYWLTRKRVYVLFQ